MILVSKFRYIYLWFAGVRRADRLAKGTEQNEQK